jgi:hypothetical protein
MPIKLLDCFSGFVHIIWLSRNLPGMFGEVNKKVGRRRLVAEHEAQN